MSEKIWLKTAKIIVRASGHPLFKPNDTMINLLQTLLTEDQAKFLLNFRNPILTFAKLKQKTAMEDNALKNMLDSIMDEGIILDMLNEDSNIIEYRLLSPFPEFFEHTLIKEGTKEKRKKLAKIYDKMLKEASEMIQKNYETIVAEFKARMPAYTRIVPIDKELIIPEEETLPFYEVSKIVDRYDTISLSRCPCKFEKELLDDPCKMTTDQFRCFHFGTLGRYYIEHGFGKPITKEDAKKILLEAVNDGLVHKAFHYNSDINKEENALCNCCKCCCILFQSYYRGVWPFHTKTSYIAEIDENTCTGCGTCVEKCPTEAIYLIDNISNIDKSKCIGCGVCVALCPEKSRTLLKTELRSVYLPVPKVVQSD